jgi:prevent-host-death family protein
MEVVTIHRAKTELSKLLKRVEAGEEIVIARGDKHVARLMPAKAPVEAKRGGRGSWKGKFSFPDSFLDPMTEEELADWEGPIEPSP